MKDGVLTFTYVKTSEPKYIPAGKEDRYQIIRVRDRELAILISENQTNILQRSH